MLIQFVKQRKKKSYFLPGYHGKDSKLNGKRVFISAVSDGPKTGVILSAIDEKFWKNHFFAYGRILPPSQEDLEKEAD